ncbi:hypothetical protein ACJIZ3_015854 [Penstemon smallii]|uniref:Uncharacterized protein n=1 Tax=Penstemon smallii TaxID=265156 RepID=A0ABD3RTS5_9LAMI
MPTFTTVALENLLEPTVRISLKKNLNSVVGPANELPDPNLDSNPRHLYISPALYVTPEQAPIAEYSSPDPLSPSPYVVNHKRRLLGGNEIRSEVPDLPPVGESSDFRLEEEEESVGDNFVNNNNLVDDDDENGVDDLVSEGEARQIESRSFVSAQGEFFDANDDFSSDGSISNTPSSSYRIESELHALRFSLREEIERRNSAEQTVILMHCQWKRISKLMSQAGFTFPAPPAAGDILELDNKMDQFCQEVVVSRFVAESIGRGEARAEAEEAAAKVLESKDQEIMRLRDRLQYYETVNHDMSQRKLVEVARRQQDRKKRRRRWIWSVMGLSVATAASLVAYSSYVGSPTSKYLPLLKSGDSKTS